MKIAFIADGRAEHTKRWIRYFGSTGDTVMLLSTYPCEPIENVQVEMLPGIFRPGNAFVKSSDTEEQSKQNRSKLARLGATLAKYGIDGLVRPLWHRLSTVDVIWQVRAAEKLLQKFNPDIVHALRIPNETFVLGGVTYGPKVASVWGQDFIYNCRNYAIHRWLTKRTLPKLDAITADCIRDLNLAKEHGCNAKLSRFFPTNGGVDTSNFISGSITTQRKPILVYARGFGPYLRPETLFESVTQLTSQFPDLELQIIAPESQIEVMHSRMQHFGIKPANFQIKPFQSPVEWAQTLREATAYVSPSISDGTPNGMLEAMACGAIPIMGNIESIREWIEHDKNGQLFAPESVEELTSCLRKCLEDDNFRGQAIQANRDIILDRCARETVMPNIRIFYEEVVERCKNN